MRTLDAWLHTLPWQFVAVAGASLALNLASDLANSFSAAPRFGGPLVAWAQLLLYGALFALGVAASVRTDLFSHHHARQRVGSEGGPSLARAQPWLVAALLLATLVANVQTIRVMAVSWPRTLASAANYGSDEMYYAHYNAWLTLHGRNPYAGDNLASALRYFQADKVTLLRVAPFTDPLRPPSQAQERAIVAAYLAHPQAPHPNLEPATTHSYPALSFLLALPAVWLGLPAIGLTQVLGLLALIAGIVAHTPARYRVVALALCLMNVDGARSVAGSDFAIWIAVGVALVWLMGSLRRQPWDAVALGAVCAVQQTAWFFAPFYLVWIWREQGIHAAVRGAGVALGTFLAINLPWIILTPGAWLRSLVLPMTLPLFPTGSGLVGLGLGGALPVWSPLVYSALEFGAYAALLATYARWEQVAPYAGMVLPPLALMLAWRSPNRYVILLPFLILLAAILTLRDAPIARAAADPIPAE
jgi:uncharacterized membrane protein